MSPPQQNESTDIFKKFFDPFYLSRTNQNLAKQGNSVTRNDEDHKKYDAATPAQVNAVLQGLLSKPQSQAELERLVATLGYPAWDKSRYYKGTKGEKMLVTAFVLPNADAVSGFLVSVKKGNESHYNLYRKASLIRAFNEAPDAKKPCIADDVLHLLTADRVLFNQKNERLLSSVTRYLPTGDTSCARCTWSIEVEKSWVCTPVEGEGECNCFVCNAVYSIRYTTDCNGGGGTYYDPYYYPSGGGTYDNSDQSDGGWTNDPYDPNGGQLADNAYWLPELGSLNTRFTPYQRQWMDANRELWVSFLALHNNDDHSLASLGVYADLERKNFLNLTPEESKNLIGTFINESLVANNLFEQAALPGDLWYNVFKTEAQSNGIPPDWLKAIHLSITQGWELFLKPLSNQIKAYANELGISFPSSSDEWYVLSSAMAPILLDLATDFIPGISEAKDIARAFDAALEGRGGDAALNMISAIAGIIPVGTLIKSVTKLDKVSDACKTGFKLFKIIKAVSSFSSNIFIRLREFVEQGWKLLWDNTNGKMVVKSGSEQITGEIAENGVPTIIQKAFASIIDATTFKQLTPKRLTNSGSVNYLDRAFINTNGLKFNTLETK